MVRGRGFAGITRRAAAKPLIAAIEGFAVAGGLEVALACDLIVAARGARLGIPEVKRSLVAAGGGLLRLPRMLPRNIAMELALTGEPMLAERGYELGLVNRLTEPGGALEAALELAERIAENAPLALAASKRILQRVGRLARDGVLRPPGGDRRARDALRGRARGRDRVRREAAADLEGPLSATGGAGRYSVSPQAVATTDGSRRGCGARTGRCPARSRAPAGPGRQAASARVRAVPP